jgi:tetratricopeptide (TPR) repeat protein
VKSNKFIFLAMLLTASLPATPTEAKLSPKEIQDLSYQAGQLFRSANDQIQIHPAQARDLYDQTILRYRKIMDEGEIVNGYLYYNIGNAYLLKGDIGRAILNYRRAQQLEPGYTDLAKNIDFARSQRLDQVPVKAQQRVLHTLFFWHYDFSSQTRFLLAACFWGFAFLAGTTWLWRSRGKFALALMGILLLLSVCLATSLAWETYTTSSEPEGVIVAEQVIARQGDGENYPASFTDPLHSGTEFEILEKRSDWLRIELSNGDQAWVPAHSAQII